MQKNNQNSKNFSSSQRLFEGDEDVLCADLDLAIAKRKNDWIAFFNEHQTNAFIFHSQSMLALLHAFEKNDIIKEQTGIEFELSKAFYTELFELKRQLIFSDEIPARKILMLSLIFGKYPGMFLCSISNYFAKCECLLSEKTINQFFEEALTRYETPHYIIHSFQNLNSIDLEVLMQALKGKNMRKHSVFNALPTKKEFTQLMQLKSSFLTVNDHFFVRGLIYLKLKSDEEDEPTDEFQTNESALISIFLKASHTYENNPKKYLEDITFWKQGFELIVNGMYDYLVFSITDCVDYLEYMKYQSGTEYSLKGRTSESLSRAIHHWHHHVFNEEHAHLKHMKWDKTEELDLHFSFEQNQYACIQLSSGKELIDEGRIMKNCVITYARSCANLYCTVWSFRTKRKVKFVPFLTVEVIDKTIVQARSKANSLPSDKQIDILHDWAKRMDYKIDLYKNE
jgi:hypothetical protein